MRLETVKLWNFRKFGSGSDELNLTKPDLVVCFTKGLNVLIGENDSGKTAIIDAIKLTLDTHSSEWVKLVHEDFHEDTNRLRIECKFANLIDSEAKNFIEWLGMDGEGEDAKPHLKVILDASRKDGRIFLFDRRAGADDEGSQLNAEARDYLRTTYLKPLRDAKSELIPRRNSRLSQILSGHNAFKGKDKDHVLKKLSWCWDCLFKKYFDGKHAPESCKVGPCPYEGRFFSDPESKNEGEDIQNGLQSMVDEFFGHSEQKASFGVSDKELRNILEQFKLSLNDDKLGLGSHNLLFMAAELLNLKREDWTGARMALIEELEAHLHPQAQMRVIEYLEEFANGTEGKDVQVVLTTHSPNLASKVKLDNLIICHDKQVFPLRKGLTELEPDDYVFLEKFIDVTKANLFFAKGIILVEGWSEEILLPALAKSMGINLTDKGVSIVNVANTAFLKYAKIFRRKDGQEMNIPVAIITDVDVREYEKNALADSDGNTRKDDRGKVIYEYNPRGGGEVTGECDARIVLLKKEYKAGNTQVFIAPRWTLEYSLYKSSSLSTQFEEITKVIHPQIDKNCSFEQGLAAKLINGGLKKTEIAYRLAKSVEDDCQSKTPTISIDKENDALNYIVRAIQHACGK